jgi:hypothetical protein
LSIDIVFYCDIVISINYFPCTTEIENFLSDEECEDIIFMARTQGLEDSRTLLHGVFKVNESVLASIIKDPDEAFKSSDANEDGVIDKAEVMLVD